MTEPFASLAGEIGCPKSNLDTPVLLLDLGRFDRNVRRIAETCRKFGVAWRPHTKTMKTPAIAHKLLQAGAAGITCAKLGEAEIMAAAGIRDILVANQVVGSAKAVRLGHVQSQASVMVALDSQHNAAELNGAAVACGAVIPVLVEVNTGQDRAGLEPGQATLDFVRGLSRYPGLRVRGLMTWEAHAARPKDPAEKQRAVQAALRTLVATAELCRSSGLAIDVVSCGGTATYRLSAACPGVTEIQAGGGVFGDVRYRADYGVDLEYALTLLATVTSRPNPTRVVCDAGKKAMSVDGGLPLPLDLPPQQSIRLNAEHTIVELEAASDWPRVGDRVEFVVGCADTTVHLHDCLYGLRNHVVESVWAIQGRGKLR